MTSSDTININSVNDINKDRKTLTMAMVVRDPDCQTKAENSIMT